MFISDKFNMVGPDQTPRITPGIWSGSKIFIPPKGRFFTDDVRYVVGSVLTLST